MFNPNEERAFMEDQKRRLIREVKLNQLMQQADQDRTHTGDRLMKLVGDLMIVGGMKLKARARAVDPVYSSNL